MRLQEMYFTLKTAMGDWPDLQFEPLNGNTGFYARDLRKVDAVLNLVSVVESLRPSIDAFRGASVGLEKGCIKASIPNEAKAKAESAYNELKLQIKAIIGLCESLGMDETREGFDIKLPPDVSLQELSACAKDLDFIFTKCPILQVDGEVVSLSSVDIGSIWLTFIIGAGGIVTILGALAALIDKAIVIRSHMLTCKAQEDAARTVGLKNELLEGVVAANKELIRSFEENASAELSRQYGVTEPEEQEKLRRSLDMLSDWMSKGMEIYAAIGTPDEVKAVFPPVEFQKLASSTTKMLSDGKDEKD